MFLDPTASHLLISTTLGENYYLHAQSRQPKPLSKMRGLSLECVSWNPSQPTASTREVLLGASDGAVYETYIESTTEFYRREEKYVKLVYRTEGPISAIWTDVVVGKAENRQILISTPSSLLHFQGRLGRHGHEGGGSIFQKLFESEQPTSQDVAEPMHTVLAVTPEVVESVSGDLPQPDRIFAWLSTQGVSYRQLSGPATESKEDIFSQRTLKMSKVEAILSPGTEKPGYMTLTQWHVVLLFKTRLVILNRLDDSVVLDQVVLDSVSRPIALVSDLKKNTFWLFTSRDILEIRAEEEDRNLWRILLEAQKFEAALQYANSAAQKDSVAHCIG